MGNRKKRIDDAKFISTKHKTAKEVAYRTKCLFCRRDIITTKGSCNEGICLSCREV